MNLRGVAQFGSALGSGPRGRGFESRHSDQKNKGCLLTAFIFNLLAIRTHDLLSDRTNVRDQVTKPSAACGR